MSTDSRVLGSLSSPKYLGVRGVQSWFMQKEQFYSSSSFIQVQFLFHFWAFQTTCKMNTEVEFQVNNHYEALTLSLSHMYTLVSKYE